MPGKMQREEENKNISLCGSVCNGMAISNRGNWWANRKLTWLSNLTKGAFSNTGAFGSQI